MKSKKRLRKKFIAGLVAVAMIAGVLTLDLASNVSEAQATQATFRRIRETYQTAGLKVLEITPTADDRELGYFFQQPGKSEEELRDVINLTYGTKLNREIPQPDLSGITVTDAEVQTALDALWNNPYGNSDLSDTMDVGNYYAPWEWGQSWGRWPNDDGSGATAKAQWLASIPANGGGKTVFEYARQQLLEKKYKEQNPNSIPDDVYLAVALRRYGMIKPFGADFVDGTNSEYPIYDSIGKGIFGNDTSEYTTYDMIDGTMREGHYNWSGTNSGGYRLKAGYVLATSETTYIDDAGISHDLTTENNNFLDADGTTPITGLDTGYFYKRDAITVTIAGQGVPVMPVPGANPESLSDNNAIAPIADLDGFQFTKVEKGRGLPAAVEYVGANGNLSFTFLLNASDIYYGYQTNPVMHLNRSNRYYRLGNWIKEYILGDANLGCSVTYVPRTIDQVTAADIANADLIYISGTAEEYAAVGGDFTDALVVELYNQSAIHNKAIIMDYLIYGGGNTNIDKLALLLWQEDQKAIHDMAASSYFTVSTPDEWDDPAEVEYEINGTAILGDTGLFTTLRGTMLTGYNGNFAMNNVYVYDHHVSDFQSSRLEQYQTDARDNLGNGDLGSYYTSAAANGGFQAVLAYIKWNNEGLATNKMIEGYVTPAVAIQYILCYRGEKLTITKGTYTVLEIQPTKEFKFNSTTESMDYTLETAEVKAARNTFITKCLSDTIVGEDSQDLVTFRSVTIDEFNAMQDDLLTGYDVVYIGALHKTYFRNGSGDTTVFRNGNVNIENSTALPIYNDINMTGYIYFSSGDIMGTTGDPKERYTSRDLTVAKLTELVNYLESSGLIVVDGELMKSLNKTNTNIINPTKVESSSNRYYDHGRLENSSNMYALFDLARGTSSTTYYTNFVSEADLESGLAAKGDLTNSLNRERLILNIMSKPVTYSYTVYNTGQMNMVNYLSADSDGKYYLDFEFSFVNNAEVSSASDFYLIHFYQDMNANGRFEPSEEKSDYQVTRSADGSQAANGTDADGVTRYSLNADVVYKLRRQVPSDEGGFINWCIKIEKVTNSSVYCQETGYTAIKPREQKYINILQITPDNGSTINLEELAESDALYQYLHGTAIEDQYTITARTITVSQFERDTEKYYNNNLASFGNNQEELWTEYFNTFQRTDNTIYTQAQIANDEDKPMSVNMVILGFGSTYDQFSNSFPIYALETYIESTKPLLTTNNVVGLDINKNSNNRTWNYALLSYFGQDRYGYTFAQYNVGADNINTNEFYSRTGEPEKAAKVARYLGDREGKRAVAYMLGSGRDQVHLIPIGYTNRTRAKEFKTLDGNNSAGFINTDAVKALYKNNDPTDAATNTYVDKMNDGQIAHYPYDVGDSVFLSKTQAQRFQLDLDYDSDEDGNSDIVVWYTLGDMANAAGGSLEAANVYSATPGDGINNYYIYNYANVTFSGIGATAKANLTAGESQLFVNTLIAAYEAGLVSPTVSFYETADSNASMLDSIAVPYDENVRTDSSIMQDTNRDYLYQFVNPNEGDSTANATKAYFKIQDSNMVRGEKSAKVSFYLGVTDTASGRYTWPNGSTSEILHLQLNDNTVVSVVRIPITIYNANFSQEIGLSNGTAEINPRLEVGTMYGFYVPMSYLKDRGAAKIYIQADTGYDTISNATGQHTIRPLGTAYDMFTIIKQDLLKLD